eukprot:1159364-Pelagomonas_calceolata.AAC.3
MECEGPVVGLTVLATLLEEELAWLVPKGKLPQGGALDTSRARPLLAVNLNPTKDITAKDMVWKEPVFGQIWPDTELQPFSSKEVQHEGCQGASIQNGSYMDIILKAKNGPRVGL